MTEEAKRTAAAYKRAWRRKNKDKVRLYNIRYWEKKSRQIKESEAENNGDEEK